MIFEENCFSRYILLTDQISLPDCLYFLRYWKYEYLNYLFISLWRHKFWITEAAARGFLWKRRSWKFHKIHRKTPVSKKEALAHHTCFLVNFVKFLRTPILQNTSGRLLLELVSAFSQDCFATWPKSHDKTSNILRMKRAFNISPWADTFFGSTWGRF